MNLDHSEQLLLDTLKTLPPQSIYADAAKKEIIRGFQLYIDHRIERIEWEPHGILLVEVGARPSGSAAPILTSVRLFIQGKGLHSDCSCRRTEQEGN